MQICTLNFEILYSPLFDSFEEKEHNQTHKHKRIRAYKSHYQGLFYNKESEPFLLTTIDSNILFDLLRDV